VDVRLTYAEIVVLFDLLHWWEDDGTTEALPYVDRAELRAMWNLTAVLEPLMDECFSPEYAAVVKTARDALRDSTD
jgi:hypothetical protein